MQSPRGCNLNLDLVLDAVGIGIWEYDHVTDSCVCNPYLSVLLGHGLEQIPTCLAAWLDLIHPDDLPDVQVHVEAALRAAGNPRHEAEYRLRAADGRWIWVCTRGGVVRWDVAGRPLLTVGTLTDISERKHAELLLQTQHEFSGILAEGPNREMLLEAILDSALHLPELDGGGGLLARAGRRLSVGGPAGLVRSVFRPGRLPGGGFPPGGHDPPRPTAMQLRIRPGPLHRFPAGSRT